MGKSKRIRADRAEIDATAKISKKEDKNTKRTGIIIICVIAALLAATIALIVVSKSGVVERSNIMYESENYKVNEIMFDYLFYSSYNYQYNQWVSWIGQDYVSQHASSLISVENISKSVKESVQDYLVYCEAAKAAGVKLGDFENRKIDETIENLKKSVKSSGYTLGAIYGCDGMNYSDVRDMLEIQYLANKFSGDNKDAIRENITSDTERVLKYFEDNKADFVIGSYVSAEVSDETWKGELSTVDSSDEFIKMFIDLYTNRHFSLVAEETEEAEGDAEETENAEETAEELPEISEALLDALKKTGADMVKFIELGLDVEEVNDIDDYKAATIKEIFEAKYADGIDGEIDDVVFDYAETAANALKENITKVLKVYEEKGYADETDADKWFFAEKEEKENGELFLSAREKDEIFTSEESNFVVYVTDVPTYDNDNTKNVGHILVKVDDNEDEDELAKAKEKADNILKEFQGLAQTKENFKAVAEKYTDDSGIFYYNVKSGDMVTEFNDWIFAEDRKEGDTDVVKTTYGYHVMFFLGDGVEKWELEALENDDDDGMFDKDFAEWKSELEAKHPVKVNEKAIAKFDESIA